MSAGDPDSLFRRIFDDGPVAMGLVGPDFRLTEANAAFCRFTGYTREELLERTFADITHPDDLDTDVRLARRVFAGEVSGYSIDKRYVRKDGQVVWGELTVFLIRDAKGRPVQGMGLVQDITDRHQALDTARTELVRLARERDRILDFAGDGIYYADARGMIAFANPAAARMLGWGPDEIVGKPAHEVLHHTRADGRPYPREECPIHGPAGAERGQETLTDDVFWRPDGSSFPVHYRSAPVRPDGGVVVVFSDMSERARMETALQEASEQAARERLNAAEAERARWARDLHDETLQGLVGLHLMLASASRAPTVEQMTERIGLAQEQIENEVEKLRGLISELRPVALDELGLEASVRDLAERIQAVYGLEVETVLDLGGPDGAPGRVEPDVETAAYRIVQECLSNAARHAGASRVLVEVARRNGTLDVRVRDDGAGFRPSSDTPGFGLRGMRERVELIDGELVIESAPGAGTEVAARLPLDG